MRTGLFGAAAGAGIVVVIALALLSVVWGSTVIAPGDVLAALGDWAGLGATRPEGPVARIVTDLRLPRAAGHLRRRRAGVVGALLQTVTRNDLADPFLFGLSSGAAAGAVSVITVFGDRLGIWTLPVAAFIGGMLAAGLVLFLVSRLHGQGPARLVLAGLAVSFLFTALTNYMVFAGDQRAAHSVLFWTMGGLGLARWGNIGLAAIGTGGIIAFALLNHRRLDAFLAGESTAESLGVPVARFRMLTFLASAFATAILVALSGVIGFVGLMIPHMARRVAGPLHLRLTVLCAVFGAALLPASDLLARTLLPPQELPVGIVTSSIGAFFVVLMLMRGRF